MVPKFGGILRTSDVNPKYRGIILKRLQIIQNLGNVQASDMDTFFMEEVYMKQDFSYFVLFFSTKT